MGIKCTHPKREWDSIYACMTCMDEEIALVQIQTAKLKELEEVIELGKDLTKTWRYHFCSSHPFFDAIEALQENVD